MTTQRFLRYIKIFDICYTNVEMLKLDFIKCGTVTIFGIMKHSATFMIYDKGSSNMMVYLTNIVYGIKGLELMTGICCSEPSYCLVPTIGLGCHCCYCHSHLYPHHLHRHYYRICFYYDSIRIIRAIFRILLQI